MQELGTDSSWFVHVTFTWLGWVICDYPMQDHPASRFRGTAWGSGLRSRIMPIKDNAGARADNIEGWLRNGALPHIPHH